VSPLDDIVETADIFVTTTGNKDIIMASDMAKMKNNAIVGNIGHFDNEIDMAGLLGWQGIKRQNIKPQVQLSAACSLISNLNRSHSAGHITATESGAQLPVGGNCRCRTIKRPSPTPSYCFS